MKDNKIKAITMYQTTDGKTFHVEDSAVYHQKNIDEAETANMWLDAGMSIGQILADLGRDVPDEILYRVTKDSKLVISHWQCQDTPGYKPVRFEPGMRVYVYGDAGSWIGPCGGSVEIASLVPYAKDPNSIL